MVKDLWWRWVGVLELVANGARSRSPLAAEQYRRLHADLLQALAAEAAQCGDGERGRFLEELIVWVKPWLTQEALLRTEDEILHDLLHRCVTAGAHFGPRPSRPLQWKWIAGIVLVAAGFSVGLFTDLGSEFLTSASRQSVATVARLTQSPYWLGGAVLLAAVVYAFWPMRRT